MEGLRERFGDSAPDIHGELAQLYTCPICLDVLFEPVTLVCGHSYCVDCLYNLEMQNKNKRECPACRTKWKDWPQTSYVLNELIKRNFPLRYERGHRDRNAEAQRVREQTRAETQIQIDNRGSILANEGKVFLIGLVALFLFVFSQTRVYQNYYHHYD